MNAITHTRRACAATAVLIAGSLLAGTLVAGTQASATVAPSTPAAAPATPPTVKLAPVATIASAVDIAVRADDPTAFVVQQSGQIVPLRDGAVGAPVLDIADRVSYEGERGLLGLAFSTDGATAYVDYTDRDGNTVVAEYPVGSDGVFGQERVVYTVRQPYPNHNGGDLAIGPDGMLYIGMGDGGAANDPDRVALNLDSPLGKLLRIDPTPSEGASFSVPADNPFVGHQGALPEIWSYGLRNPWRFAFDRPTGDLWIADVGQGAWEEINRSAAVDGRDAGKGVNYGWSAFEGTHPFNADQPTEGVTPPVYEYEHGDRGCSISGGVVAHDPTLPGLDGWYVYSDFCSGQVRAIRVADDGTVTGDELLATSANVAAVVSGPAGEVYVLSLADGVLRVVPA